jgi:hypothetical protein
VTESGVCFGWNSTAPNRIVLRRDGLYRQLVQREMDRLGRQAA